MCKSITAPRFADGSVRPSRPIARGPTTRAGAFGTLSRWLRARVDARERVCSRGLDPESRVLRLSTGSDWRSGAGGDWVTGRRVPREAPGAGPRASPRLVTLDLASLALSIRVQAQAIPILAALRAPRLQRAFPLPAGSDPAEPWEPAEPPGSPRDPGDRRRAGACGIACRGRVGAASGGESREGSWSGRLRSRSALPTGAVADDRASPRAGTGVMHPSDRLLTRGWIS